MKAMKPLRKVLFFTLPVILVAVLGWSLRYESDFFLIQEMPIEIEFEGNQQALVHSLKPQFTKDISALKGKNIWAVSLKTLRNQVLENEWVNQVEVRRYLPNQIKASVKLNPVMFLYMDAGNNIYPIIQNGTKLSKIKLTQAPVAPVLRNKKIIKDPELLNKVIALYEEVPNIGALRNENIASVDYKPVIGLTLRLVEGDELVHLGEENISTKGLQVLRVTDYLKSQKQNARVIDASFSKKVLVRPRKGS